MKQAFGVLKRIQRLLWVALCGVALLGCDRGPERILELAEGGIYAGALSPDAQTATIGSVLHGGSLWNVPDHARLFNWNLDSDIDAGQFSIFTTVAYSSNGQRVLTAQGRTFVVWSSTTGQAIFFYEAPDNIRSAALDDEGLNVLLGLEDGSAALFSLVTGQIIVRLRGHQGPIYSLALAADGRRAVTGSDDNTAILWDLPSGMPLHRITHDNQVRTVALSASGVYAFSVGQRSEGLVWNTTSGQIVRRLPMNRDSMTVARFVDNDAMLLTGDRVRKVILWQLTDSSKQRQWRLKGEGLYTRSSGEIMDIRRVAGGALVLGADGRISLLQ
ncbi:WD40 repeat domain-containing protein [Salinispirillum marinum]|uniref:WD40 repeat domain-containing protein n=2 Tax=Saccharospirillaceae TaxID=255527 RepID=A0ABV8BBC3_9GAMM